MANATKLRETLAVTRANLHRWNQRLYSSGKVNPDATSWTECSTSFCLAGWRCALDGLRPRWVALDDPEWAENYPDERYEPTSTFYDPTDPDWNYVFPFDYAKNSFEITDKEAHYLFLCTTKDFAELERRVECVIAGDLA